MIVDLALVRAQRKPVPQPDFKLAPRKILNRESPFLFWTGASGARYVHSIYNLFECPPVDVGNYVLVKRHSDGRRTVLSIGRAAHTVSTLNLAEIRQRSAELGANEVHIHLLAGNTAQSQTIEADLRRSLVTA
jgi:hypothetical protein